MAALVAVFAVSGWVAWRSGRPRNPGADRTAGALRWAVPGAGLIAAAFLVVGVGLSWQMVRAASWSSAGADWLPPMLALGVGYYARVLRPKWRGRQVK